MCSRGNWLSFGFVSLLLPGNAMQIAESLGGVEVNSRAYVGKFNFTGQSQQQKVGTLSGGQRNRVHLAKLLKKGGNLLLLQCKSLRYCERFANA